MKRGKVNRPLRLHRWLLLVGVVVGIFFSNGEGLHLLPFPVSQHQNETTGVKKGNNKFYSLSTHNFSNFSLKTKYQKNCRDSILGAVRFGTFEQPEFVAFSQGQEPREAESSCNSAFLITPSDRGPPSLPQAV